MIFSILRIFYKILLQDTLWYNFDTVLYEFLETGTLDRSLIYIIQVSAYTLFHFSFTTVPLRLNTIKYQLKYEIIILWQFIKEVYISICIYTKYF